MTTQDTQSTAAQESAAETDIANVIIVGSGPAGWTAAIYTARAGLNPLVIASAVDTGGNLMKTTAVENFPGFPEAVQGPDLMSQLQDQAERFGTQVVYEDAVAVDLQSDIKTVTTESGEVYRAKAIILSTGSKYRELGIDREQELSGHGVSWCATCDGFFFKDKVIAVVGGGDSALEEATFLTRFASKVYLIHRRDALRGSKIMQDRALANPKIEPVWNSRIAEILGDDEVTGVVLEDTVTGAQKQLDLAGIFVAIGNDPNSGLFKGQLELNEDGTVKLQGRTSRTSLPGVFAAGDVTDSSYRQAIVAAGTGAVAGLDAERYLADLQAAA